MKNNKILEMLEAGQIEELKNLLIQEELSKNASGDAKKRIAGIKKLYKMTQNKKISSICKGLQNYSDNVVLCNGHWIYESVEFTKNDFPTFEVVNGLTKESIDKFFLGDFEYMKINRKDFVNALNFAKLKKFNCWIVINNIAVDSKYLEAIFQAVDDGKSDSIEIGYINELSPVLFKNDLARAIVLPIHLRSISNIPEKLKNFNGISVIELENKKAK